ncbi:hypothetical protein pb186bvf_006145 [Paramecium bursaria]
MQLIQLYYQQAEECEKYWIRDNYMATKIQAYFRMYVLHKVYQKNRAAAITIQKYSRGYLARQNSKIKQGNAFNKRNIRYFDHQASTIQRFFRGYMFRKYTTDFYVRKKQLQIMIEKNNNFLIELRQVAEIEKQQEIIRKEQQAREEFSQLATNLHHLSSTNAQPGIYRPPYAQIPKAFDVDVETHLRVAFKTNYNNFSKGRSNSFRIKRPQSYK